MMMLPVRRRPTRFCWIETPGCFSVNMPGLRSQPGGSPAEEALRSLEDEWYESEKQEQAKTRQQFWVYYHNQHRLSWTLRFGCFHNSYCDWSDLEARVKRNASTLPAKLTRIWFSRSRSESASFPTHNSLNDIFKSDSGHFQMWEWIGYVSDCLECDHGLNSKVALNAALQSLWSDKS